MLSFSDCHGIVEEHIQQLEIGDKQPAELYAPIRYILSLGGKRIRPVMTIMACNLFTEDVKPAIKPALAIEVFHNFTLIHDDIMDNANIRRNKPTVHAKWNNNIAILSGDAMQVYAYQLLVDEDSGYLKQLLDVFNTTALEVCEGQQYDMNYATKVSVSLEDYLRMIELKTSVLLAASLKIGALCGGASAQDAENLYAFGLNLGLAFQIQDDYLDVYGNQDLFGKTVGGDIAENKKTFLLIQALTLATGKCADDLQRAITNQIPNTFEKIEVVRNIYTELGVPEITCAKINEFSTRAFDYLAAVNVSESQKTSLRQVVTDLMSREK